MLQAYGMIKQRKRQMNKKRNYAFLQPSIQQYEKIQQLSYDNLPGEWIVVHEQ